MVTETWKCAAIDHGVAVFPDGRIGPCCQVSPDYLKPITELSNPDRFADLKVVGSPPACEACSHKEHNNLRSYRSTFNNLATTGAGLQFVDLRNTNLCNLKCRYCGPHFSSQWAQELGYDTTHQSIDQWHDILFTDSLHWMYFTGGEPLINPEHWQLLQQLVDDNRAHKISLLYSTNLTTIRYKDLNIVDLWNKFKSVHIQCSVDAVGLPLEFIRSGTDWSRIQANLDSLNQLEHNNISIKLTPVISVLNFWFLDQLYEYAQQNSFPVDPIVLTGPDYLALDVIPDQLKELALSKLEQVRKHLNTHLYQHLNNLIVNNDNQCLFNQTVTHVLLLDNNRKEKLFDLLPFKQAANHFILKNYEYQ